MYALPLFVPADFAVPEGMQTDTFKLRPLTINDVELDFEAVVSSAAHLKSVWPTTDWPDGLTLAQDLIDLGWHQKEFELRRSFAYTVINHTETQVLGCVYIYPSDKVGVDAEIYLWARQSELGNGLETRLYEAVSGWLSDVWPFYCVAFPGRDTAWEDWEKRASKFG